MATAPTATLADTLAMMLATIDHVAARVKELGIEDEICQELEDDAEIEAAETD